MLNETHLAQTNPPTKACIAHCLLCLKHVPSPHENGVGSKTKDFEKRFFVLLERYLIASSQNSHVPSSSSRGQSSNDNFTKDDFPICGNCFQIVDSFCDLYHEARKLELQLDWKIWKLKSIMVCAGRVPSRITAVQEYYKDKKEIADKICNYRKRVISQCSKKLCGQFPRVALAKVDQDSNNTSRAADASNLKLSSHDASFTETSQNVSVTTELSEPYQLNISETDNEPNSETSKESPKPKRHRSSCCKPNTCNSNEAEVEQLGRIPRVTAHELSESAENIGQNDDIFREGLPRTSVIQSEAQNAVIGGIPVVVDAPEIETVCSEPSISQEVLWEQSNTEISFTRDQRETQLLEAWGNDTKRPKKTTAKPKGVRSYNLKQSCVETETSIAVEEVHDEVVINVEGAGEIFEEIGTEQGINVEVIGATETKGLPSSPSEADDIFGLPAPDTSQEEEVNRNLSPVTSRILNGFQERTAISESQSRTVNLQKEIECIDLEDDDMDTGPSVWDAHFEDTEHKYTPGATAVDNNANNALKNAPVQKTTLVNGGYQLLPSSNAILSNESPAIYRMQQFSNQTPTANFTPAPSVPNNPSYSLTGTGVRYPYVAGPPTYQYSNPCPPQCTPETCPQRFQNSQQTFALRNFPVPRRKPQMEPIIWPLRPQHSQPSNPDSNNFTRNPAPSPLMRQPVNAVSCQCDMCINPSRIRFSGSQRIVAGPPMRFSSNFQLQNYEAEIRKMYFPNQSTQVTSAANPSNNTRTVLTTATDYYRPANTTGDICHQDNCCEPVQFANPQTPVVVPSLLYDSAEGYHRNTMTTPAVPVQDTLSLQSQNMQIQPSTTPTEEISQNYSLRSIISCGKCNRTFTSASSHDAHQAWHNTNEVEPSVNDMSDNDDNDDDEFNYYEDEDKANSESSDDEKYESKEFKLKPEADSSDSNHSNCDNTDDRKFKCPLCPASWLTLRQLISHVILVHPEDPEQVHCTDLSMVRYKCGIVTLETQILFLKLTNENESIKDIGEIVVERLREIYACKISDCRAVFLFPEELELHSKHHGEFKCNFCEVTKSLAPHLTIHEWQKHSTRGKYSDFADEPSSGKSSSQDSGQDRPLTENPVSNERTTGNSSNVGVAEAGSEDKLDNERYRFHCPRCSFRSRTKSRLIEHHLLDHLSLKSSLKMCYICKKEFTAQNAEETRSSILDHIKLYHNLSGIVDSSGIKRCDQCSTFFSTWDQLSRHRRRVHHKDDKTCQDCGKNFPFRKALRIHRRNVHKVELNIKCVDEECKEEFETEMDLQIHVTWVHKHKKLRLACPQCKRTFLGRGSLNAHIRSHQYVKKPKVPKPKRFVCEHCGKAFQVKDILERHYLSHSGPNTWEFMCSVCSKKCLTKQKLDEHMRIHTKEQPFVCQYCGAKYAHRHNLRIHVNNKHADIAKDIPRQFDRTNLSSKKGRRLKPPQNEQCSSNNGT